MHRIMDGMDGLQAQRISHHHEIIIPVIMMGSLKIKRILPFLRQIPFVGIIGLLVITTGRQQTA
jgi:hypothetical protein